MNIHARLARLERTHASFGQSAHEDAPAGDNRTLSDEEEADETGRFLWMTGLIGRKRCHRPRSYPVSAFGDAMRAWDEGMDAALAAGYAEYHTDFRPLAMAIWLIWKPGHLRHRRTHGTWVWDQALTAAELMSQDEFEALPVNEQMRAFREMLGRKGHWTGPSTRDAIAAE